MDLPIGWSIVLILAAVWNLIIWPQFFRRISKDPRSRDATGRATRFYTVHAVLIGVSLVLGIAVGVLGVVVLF